MSTLACSNILYNNQFNTDYDFSVSFVYKMDTQSITPVNNNGFGLFFIDGNNSTLTGGGSGVGLGAIKTDGTSVSGMFAIVGFDVQGTFTQINSISAFTTGNASQNPLSIGARVSTNYTFLSALPLPDVTAFDYDIEHTIRLDVRNKFRTITVNKLLNNNYYQLATFNSSYLIDNGVLPALGKFGISYSGDTIFTVKDINLNYTSP